MNKKEYNEFKKILEEYIFLRFLNESKSGKDASERFDKYIESNDLDDFLKVLQE